MSEDDEKRERQAWAAWAVSSAQAFRQEACEGVFFLTPGDALPSWRAWKERAERAQLAPNLRQQILNLEGRSRDDVRLVYGSSVLTAYYAGHRDARHAAAELVAARASEARILPHPASPEASGMMDAVLAEYNWPASSKNAARAGWEAANRWLQGARANGESLPDTPNIRYTSWCDTHSRGTPCDKCAALPAAPSEATPPNGDPDSAGLYHNLAHTPEKARASTRSRSVVAWGVIGADGKLLLAEKRILLAYFDNPPRPLVWGDGAAPQEPQEKKQ